MPTKRRRLGHSRRDVLTDVQRIHLVAGSYLICHLPHEEFVDQAHRRQAWTLHREEILETWDFPGRRPSALWEYDFSFRRDGWDQWSWPRPIAGEAEMVHRLLTEGVLRECRFNGTNPIASELAELEASWLREIELTVGYRAALPTIKTPLVTWGTPPWFWRKHAPRIHAERQAERAKYRASRERPVASNGGAME